MDYEDIKKGFRKQVAEIVTNYDLLKDMVENTDPNSEYFVIIKEEMLKEYNSNYVEELLEQWVK